MNRPLFVLIVNASLAHDPERACGAEAILYRAFNEPPGITLQDRGRPYVDELLERLSGQF
ncbi:MAG: hypothetical protein JW945_02735 [Methanomicrobia archaeon]|nr:hypothetical protein [Methanomicrobia archaeon]